MSSIFQAFNGFIDKGVDLFFKKVLMVEEIPVLRRYEENYFSNNNNNDNNNNPNIPEHNNNTIIYNSNNMNSENSIADPNFTRADIDMFNSRNNSVYNSDHYSSNEHTDKNVFAKLTSGKSDKGKNIRNKNAKDIKEFNINDINYQIKLNREGENQDENVFSNITGKARKSKSNLNNINNSYSHENSNHLNNDNNDNNNNNRPLNTINSKSEKDLNSLNQLNIFNKINIKNESEIEGGFYFNNNFGNHISEDISATDLISRRSKRTNENPGFGSFPKASSVQSRAKSTGVFRNNLYGQSSNRNKLRGNQQKVNSHGFDSNNFNDDEIFEINVDVGDESNVGNSNNYNKDLDKNEAEVNKDLNGNNTYGAKNEENNLNKKKKASNFRKIGKETSRKEK